MDINPASRGATSGGRRQFLGRAAAVAAVAVGGPPALAAGSARAADEQELGRRVLAVARGQLGVPYAWGGGDRLGAGPGYCQDGNGYLDGVCTGEDTVGFDCSGLTLYCWYAASSGAVDLAHYTVAQYHKGVPVAQADLIAGDLLFFSRPDDPLHHVGLCTGDGGMIHAAHTGTPVALLADVFHDPAWGPQYAGAVRPAPTAVRMK